MDETILVYHRFRQETSRNHPHSAESPVAGGPPNGT